MGIPDSFDPLMDLDHAKSAGDAEAPAIPASGLGPRMPQTFTSLPTFANVDFGSAPNPTSTGNQSSLPPDVDQFNGGII